MSKEEKKRQCLLSEGIKMYCKETMVCVCVLLTSRMVSSGRSTVNIV